VRKDQWYATGIVMTHHLIPPTVPYVLGQLRASSIGIITAWGYDACHINPGDSYSLKTLD
jgi:hypothetical protein